MRIASPALLFVFAAIALAGDPPRQSKPDAALVFSLKGAIERAVTGEKEETRAAALEKLREAPPLERAEALVESLGHGVGKVRIFAANALAEEGERRAIGPLAFAAVREPEKGVRVEIFRAMKRLDVPGTALFFRPYLREDAPARRARALLGIAIFPDARVVPALVEHLRITASGYGRASVSETVERAVIAGWQVVSGGPPNNVVEVAEPELGTVRTGVSMDVKVKRAEIELTVAVLQTLTGEKIGADPDAWRAYVEAHRAASD